MLVDSKRGTDFSHNIRIRIRRPTIERKATRRHGSSSLRQQRAAFVASGRCVFQKRFQETTAFTNILSTLQQRATMFSTNARSTTKGRWLLVRWRRALTLYLRAYPYRMFSRRVLICASRTRVHKGCASFLDRENVGRRTNYALRGLSSHSSSHLPFL